MPFVATLFQACLRCSGTREKTDGGARTNCFGSCSGTAQGYSLCKSAPVVCYCAGIANE